MVVVAFVVPWLVLVLLACGAAKLVAWLATRRVASRARSALEERVQAGDAVLMRGVLRVEGAGLDSDWGGSKKLAAVGAIRSRSRLWPRRPVVDGGERCATLWLDTPKGSVRLDGPSRVEAGARQRWKGDRVLGQQGKWFAGEYAIFDGDEVVAAGVSEAAPLSGASTEGRYRDSATHEALSPLPDGAIGLATVRWAPAASMRQVVRLPAVVIVALAAVYPSYSSASALVATETDCADMCHDNGRCIVGFESWSKLQKWKKTLQGDVYRCVAQHDADCRRSASCQSTGSCTAIAGRCVAASDDDCHLTDGCLQRGECGAQDGHCVALRDADCREQSGCVEMGRCAARDGSCAVGSAADCEGSYYCRALGYCSRVGDACKVAKDEDCRQSNPCASLGHCSARDGDCTTATNQDCRRLRDCRVDGQCTFVPAKGCVVATEADCLASKGCARNTRCRRQGAACVSDGPCRESAACRVHGHCDGDGYCGPASDDDCRRSENCERHGACRWLEGECAASCAARDECSKRGLCSFVEPHGCGAAGDDCRKSELCRLSGQCTAADGRCVARSDDDCRRSDHCRWEGRCSLQDDYCVATGDDCLATRACKSISYCLAEDGRCTRGRGDDYCRQSRLCKKLGRCAWGSYACVASSDEDCRQSEVCGRYGWCEKVEEDCFVRER